MKWWKVLIVFAIGAVGTGLTALFYTATVANENDVARSTVKATFNTFLDSFQSFTLSQMRSIRAVADAMSTHGSLPPLSVMHTVSDHVNLRLPWSRL